MLICGKASENAAETHLHVQDSGEDEKKMASALKLIFISLCPCL